MGAHSVDLSVVQDDDLIRMHDGGDPLGDDQFCHGRNPGKPRADPAFRSGVHGAGGIIEDKDLRML